MWAKNTVESKCGNYRYSKSIEGGNEYYFRYLQLDRDGNLIKSDELKAYYLVVMQDSGFVVRRL